MPFDSIRCLKDSPVSGMPILRNVPFLPILMLVPLLPNEVLTPFLPKNNLTPGATFFDLRNLKPIVYRDLVVMQKYNCFSFKTNDNDKKNFENERLIIICLFVLLLG